MNSENLKKFYVLILIACLNNTAFAQSGEAMKYLITEPVNMMDRAAFLLQKDLSEWVEDFDSSVFIGGPDKIEIMGFNRSALDRLGDNPKGVVAEKEERERLCRNYIATVRAILAAREPGKKKSEGERIVPYFTHSGGYAPRAPKNLGASILKMTSLSAAYNYCPPSPVRDPSCVTLCKGSLSGDDIWCNGQ